MQIVLIIASDFSTGAVVECCCVLTESYLLLELLCRHQAQVGGGADLSRLGKTNFFERR